MTRSSLLLIISLLSFSKEIIADDELKKISDLSLAPVSTFSNYCSRCHGEEGFSYEQNFNKNKEDSLKIITEEMMIGPAELNPAEAEIEAMTAYNKSVKLIKPFAAIFNAGSFISGKDKTLKVETSSHAVIEVEDKDVVVKKSNGFYELAFDYSNKKTLTIFVKNKKGVSLIKFPNEIWSR